MSSAADPQLWAEIRRLEERLSELRGRVVGIAEREQLAPGDLPLLLFRVGGEQAAIAQRHVLEVVMMCKLTPLPEAPAWIPGVLNCRGQSVLVVDVLARLGRAARRPALSDLIVVCEVQGRRVGLIVQEILGVETVAAAAVQAPSQGLDQAPYLLGVLQSGTRTVLLVSVKALIATSSLPDGAP
ncbi:MAG: purine-binding chemotaxis protein CheW [Deltaproteobacteria bacterium]|nr:purine-binding chemotaxis protein CheW [Deltaproteobacteria bacterium]